MTGQAMPQYGWELEVVAPSEASKGGPGSGHHGHAGRPGKRGGSAPGTGGGGDISITTEDGEVVIDQDTASVRAARAAKTGKPFETTLYRGTGTDPSSRTGPSEAPQDGSRTPGPCQHNPADLGVCEMAPSSGKYSIDLTNRQIIRRPRYITHPGLRIPHARS